VKGVPMAKKPVKPRWVRLLEACEGRRFDEAFDTDSQFRKDLKDEAKSAKKYSDRAVLTPEMLSSLNASIDRRFPMGARPVVIVPGCLCSSLKDEISNQLIWLNPLYLEVCGIGELQLAPYCGSQYEQDADSSVRIKAWEAFHWLYDPLDDYLTGRGFATRLFPYDWRKDVDHPSVAPALKELVLCLHDRCQEPVDIVAHSLGGLVARRVVQCLCEQLGAPAAKEIVGNLVLLGPAVSGTFIAALGLAASLQEMPFFVPLGLDPELGFSASVQETTKTWTTLYQLLPWDDQLLPSLETNDIRQYSFWDGEVEELRLQRAFPSPNVGWAAGIVTQCFCDQTSVFLGHRTNCHTASGVEWSGGQLLATYSEHACGDGFMLHCCSVLPDTNAFLAEGVHHLALAGDQGVMDDVVNVLNGDPVNLPEYRPIRCPEQRAARSRPSHSRRRLPSTRARRS
jgi:hypothetical protein